MNSEAGYNLGRSNANNDIYDKDEDIKSLNYY